MEAGDRESESNCGVTNPSRCRQVASLWSQQVLSITSGELINNIRYGPCGGIYRIVTTTAQTSGIIFALECTEKPGGGPPLHIHGTEEEYFFVTEGEITFFIDGKITK